jgi:hypothetical protein
VSDSEHEKISDLRCVSGGNMREGTSIRTAALIAESSPPSPAGGRPHGPKIDGGGN